MTFRQMDAQETIRPPAAPAAEASPLAASAAPLPAGPLTPGPSGRRIDPLGSLRRHPVLAFLVAAVVSLASLPIAIVKGKPTYEATAAIFVSPRFQANLQDAKEVTLQSDSEYRNYLQQQVRTINRYDIVEEALRRIGPLRKALMNPKETDRHFVERMQGAFDINHVTDTYQISVTLQGAKREGLAEAVNALVNTFLEKAKVEEFYASDQRLKDLDQDRQRLQEEIETKQARRTEIAQELGVTTFTENYVNPYDRLLVDAKEALATAARQRIEAQAQLDAVNPERSAAAASALDSFGLDIAAKDSALTSLEANLNQRRGALMAASSGLQPDHPGRRAADRELAELQATVDKVRSGLVKQYASMVLQQRQTDAFRANQVEKQLAAAVDQQASQASWFTTKYQEGMALGLDIDRARKRQDSIEERVDFLSLERRAPGFARLFSAARVPDEPVKGGRRKIALIGLFAGLFLGLLVPMAVDFLDPRMRLPGDVERVLGFPTLGWLMKKKQAGPEFAREQVYRIAARLSQDQQMHGSRIFAFTAAAAGSGTSTLVTEIARALTRLGVSTLAVEANAYRSDPRYRKPGSRGLTVVLRGGDHLDSAIVPGDDELPDHVPVGDVQDETSLPDILNLISILRDAASMYGAILIDLPPLLVSVDAEMIVRTADVAVLVVESEAITKPELDKVARSLERLHPRAVSVVVNKVDINAGGGFGRTALTEFQSGEAPKPPRWASPWLWK